MDSNGNINKPTCVIYASVETYSGYGAASRDKIKVIHELYKNEWDIKILPCGWGTTPTTFIDDHIEWQWLKELFISPPLTYQPDIMIWITVPNEAQQIGKWNCLFTAGIETNICSPTWIEGVNRMDLTIVPSTHSQTVFQNSMFQKKDTNTNQLVGEIKLEKPVEVLFEGFNPDIYKKDNTLKNGQVSNLLNNINEDFAFLFTGMWLPGDFEKDRKNVSGLVRIFLEVFKNKKSKPALVLKTSSGSASIMDRNSILEKIDSIRKSINSKNLPNIYLLHGDLHDTEMNELYNHNKIKAMISLTKGEGFGRPLLEFSQTQKPIIASGWGGQIDFLKSEFTSLIGGNLEKVDKSAQIKDMIIDGSSWFQFDHNQAGSALKDYFENYKKYKVQGKRLAHYTKENFALSNMKTKLKEIFDANVKLPLKLKMPKLIKLD